MSDEQQEITYCLYARKSSESDERQALSIDSQIKEMHNIANRDGLKIVEILRESHSAKSSGQRPIYREMLSRIRDGEFNGILTWAPDRMSRNGGDLGELVDLMDQGKLLEIRTAGQIFRNSPNEKFLLMILCSQAKLENDNRGINAKRGMRNKCEMGWLPCLPPLGYLNDKLNHTIIVDPERAPLIKEMFRLVAEEEYTGRQVWRWANEEADFRSRTKMKLSLSTVHKILKNIFYYGDFQHGGKIYKGKHEPLISRDRYNKVQEVIAGSPKGRYGEKLFSFTRIMICGHCGSGITAQEKVKKLKNGEARRHVYYHCSAFSLKNCKNKWMREIDLADQFERLIDNLDIDDIGMQKQLQEEIDRFNKFTTGVLGMNPEIQKLPKIDLRTYAKYIIREGSHEEKREVLKKIKNKVLLRDGQLSLAPDRPTMTEEDPTSPHTLPEMESA